MTRSMISVVVMLLAASCAGAQREPDKPVSDETLRLEVHTAVVHIYLSIDAAEGLPDYLRLSSKAKSRYRDAIAHARAAATRLDTCQTPSLCEAAANEVSRLLRDLTLATKRILPPEPPQPDPGNNDCIPKPWCPHKGGDNWHNLCADREPPNIWPGCDALVADKRFDAFTSAAVLWEIKTEAWSTQSEWLRHLTLIRHSFDASIDAARARRCGFAYVYGIADRELFNALAQSFGESGVTLKHLPNCDRRHITPVSP